MTTYFNKKEEVIEIQLTQYGKYLLSKGKLAPAFYSFYDDDILYDGSHGGVTELQNDIVNRIKGTPYLRAVYDFSSSIEFPKPYSKESLGVIDTNHALNKPIGTIDSAKDFKPAWKVRKARNSAANPTGSHQYLETYNRGQRVPQMEFTGSITYSSQSYGLIVEDEKPVVLNLEEVNGVFKPRGNFSVEVFEVVSGAITRQLYFIPEMSARAEDDFIKASEEDLLERYPDLNNTFAEYYLDIRVDREIDDTDQQVDSVDIYTDDDGTGEVC